MKRLPTTCPSCGSQLEISELHCPACGTTVRGAYPLDRFAALSTEEEQFLLTFLAARGNLKEVQDRLDLSYPTVRSRLDKVLGSLGRQPMKDRGKPARKLDVMELLEKLESGNMSVDAILKTIKGETDEPATERLSELKGKGLITAEQYSELLAALESMEPEMPPPLYHRKS